jgi:hypothetical protein
MDDCHFSYIKKIKKIKNPGILPPIKVGDFSVLSRTGMD